MLELKIFYSYNKEGKISFEFVYETYLNVFKGYIKLGKTGSNIYNGWLGINCSV